MTDDLDEAIRLRAEGNTAKALEYAERAMSSDPSSVDSLTLGGALRCEQGLLPGGNHLLRWASFLTPKDEKVWMNWVRSQERMGELASAYRVVGRAISVAPADVAAWRARDRLARILGISGEASASSLRLHQLVPDDLGVTMVRVDDLLFGGGGAAAAERLLESALVVDPAAKETWHRWSRIRQEDQRFASAVIGARRVASIVPQSEHAFFSLGMVFLKRDFSLDAIDALLKSVTLAPAFAEAWVSLGVTEKTVGRIDRALRHLPRALVVRPDFALAAARLGRILAECGRRYEAESASEMAVRLDPLLLDGWLSYGFVLRLLEKHSEAQRAFSCCIALRPEQGESWVNLGIINQLSGDLNAALKFHSRALALNAFSREARPNLAFAMKALGRFEEAAKLYAMSIVSSPDLFDAYLNAGICNLLLGRYRLGWEQYEHRWRSEAVHLVQRASPRLETSRPEFRGDAVSRSRRVLVWAEQGLGDEIMFGSLLPEFRNLCGELLVQLDRRLLPLFSRALPGVRVLERGQFVPELLYDEQIPIGSLGKWLRPTRESFEGKAGRYLAAEAGAATRLRRDLGVTDDEALVGLSWRSASPIDGSARSLNLSELAVALTSGERRIRLLNLQYGDVSKEIASLRSLSGIDILSHPDIDNLENMNGLASLIEACDLVVSVGNATAHLSGALGKATMVLLPHVAGWRWLHEGTWCPWYSSVTLYRQTTRGDWTETLRQLRSSVCARAQGFTTRR